MKKNVLRVVVMIFVLLVVFFIDMDNAKANPVPAKEISHCIKINNINNFSNLSLVVSVIEQNDVINNNLLVDNKCLEKSDNAIKATLYATRTDYLQSINFKDKKLSNSVYFLGTNLPKYETLNTVSVPPDSNYNSIEDIYSISGFADRQLILYKSSEIIKHNDGTSDKVENFPNPDVGMTDIDINQVIAYDPSSPTPTSTPTSTSTPTVTSSPSPTSTPITSNPPDNLINTGLPLTIMLIVVVVAIVIGVVYFIITVRKRS